MNYATIKYYDIANGPGVRTSVFVSGCRHHCPGCFKALYPGKTVWCYSGYTWEQLTGAVPCPARCEVTDELLSLLDVLVDGRFVQAEHDISLRFRGSRNQRLLDVPRSLAAHQPVWWQDEKVFATHTME